MGRTMTSTAVLGRLITARVHSIESVAWEVGSEIVEVKLRLKWWTRYLTPLWRYLVQRKVAKIIAENPLMLPDRSS